MAAINFPDILIDGDNSSASKRINRDIEKLIDAWRTEMNAPEILPYCGELVESTKDMLLAQQVQHNEFSAL